MAGANDGEGGTIAVDAAKIAQLDAALFQKDGGSNKRKIPEAIFIENVEEDSPANYMSFRSLDPVTPAQSPDVITDMALEKSQQLLEQMVALGLSDDVVLAVNRQRPQSIVMEEAASPEVETTSCAASVACSPTSQPSEMAQVPVDLLNMLTELWHRTQNESDEPPSSSSALASLLRQPMLSMAAVKAAALTDARSRRNSDKIEFESPSYEVLEFGRSKNGFISPGSAVSTTATSVSHSAWTSSGPSECSSPTPRMQIIQAPTREVSLEEESADLRPDDALLIKELRTVLGAKSKLSTHQMARKPMAVSPVSSGGSFLPPTAKVSHPRSPRATNTSATIGQAKLQPPGVRVRRLQSAPVSQPVHARTLCAATRLGTTTTMVQRSTTQVTTTAHYSVH